MIYCNRNLAQANNIDFEGKEVHFVLEEYDIEYDVEIELKLLRKYKNFRSTEVEINDDIFQHRY